MDKRKLEDVPTGELALALSLRNSTLQMVLAFMALAPIPAFVKDASGRVIYLNSAAEAFFGKSLRDVRGMAFPEMLGITSPQIAHRIRQQDKKVLSAPEPKVYLDHLFVNGLATERFSAMKFPILCENEDTVIAGFIVTMKGEVKAA